jgi:hypothetical protein
MIAAALLALVPALQDSHARPPQAPNEPDEPEFVSQVPS